MTYTQPANSSPPTHRGCFAPLLFALLLVAGAVIFWRFFYTPIAMLADAQRWPKVPCRVFVSEIGRERLPASDRRIRRLDLRYHYTYEGNRYDSTSVWVMKPDAGEMDETRNRYPAGDYYCYVNPRDPRFSLLERDFRPELLIAIFPLSLAIIGLVGLIYELRPRRSERFADAYERRRVIMHPDGRVMRKKARGAAMLIASVVFALIYNFAIWFLVREVIEAWSDGKPGCHGLFLTGFALPFVAVGVGAIVLAVYLLTKLFNPRPTLILSSASASPGSSIEVSWHFSGRIRRIRRLRVYIEGREEATYTRGTRTCTDCEVFASIGLIDTKDVAKIPRGQTTFVVPISAAPSFVSDNNRLSWFVRIMGHVRRWPDVSDEIELKIVPAPAAEAAEVAT